MKAIVRVILVAALACGLGCARSDWIDRTLVTVDVTGAWEATTSFTGGVNFQLNLEQQGPQVKGVIRFGAHPCYPNRAGSIEGTVSGDVFSFRQTNASLTAQVTVRGDEMSGGGNGGCGNFPITLRRVNSFSPSTSPQP
jgi:hypothetical protein